MTDPRVPAPTRRSPHAWAGDLAWQPDAADAARAIVRRHTEDLRAEAERVAHRAGAGTVSPNYVNRAADHLGLHSPSRSADVMLGAGGILLGLAGGFGGALLITPATIGLALGITALLIALLGTAAFAVGAALKMKR